MQCTLPKTEIAKCSPDSHWVNQSTVSFSRWLFGYVLPIAVHERKNSNTREKVNGSFWDRSKLWAAQNVSLLQAGKKMLAEWRPLLALLFGILLPILLGWWFLRREDVERLLGLIQRVPLSNRGACYKHGLLAHFPAIKTATLGRLFGDQGLANCSAYA